MTDLSPREIVSELDRFIIGQSAAKRAVALALRGRWRRRQLPEDMREEVYPKNILMVGPTGVGKTEIARRLARLAAAPFLKVEATKFTEVGYVGRDVESIVRDLVEIAIHQVRERKRREMQAEVEQAAEERLLDSLAGSRASAETREAFRRRLRSGQLNDRTVEIEVPDTSNPFSIELPSEIQASVSMVNLGELMGKTMGRTRKRKLSVEEAWEVLKELQADKQLDEDLLAREAVREVEQDGIVFLDEIDKLCARDEFRGGNVSREGVQRDLLPLIEGTTVTTRRGAVRTDHILFIASGAFHLSKPRDLLPELQGRLPIRVELSALTQAEFERILAEPDYNLTAQCVALLETEGVKLEFTEDGIAEIASVAVEINQSVENIGARRLHTVLERLLEEVSYHAPDMSGQSVTVNREFVAQNLKELASGADIARYIL